MSSNELSLYAFSNASEDQYPDNKLNEFTNILPKTLNLKKSEKWKIGIEKIGINLSYVNIALPPKLPCLYIENMQTIRDRISKLNDSDLAYWDEVCRKERVPREPKLISFFKCFLHQFEQNMLYLPPSYYTIYSIMFLIHDYIHSINKGLSFTHIDDESNPKFGHFKLTNRQWIEYGIVMHESLSSALQYFPHHSPGLTNKVVINGEKYIAFTIDGFGEIIGDYPTYEFTIEKPKIVNVICNEIVAFQTSDFNTKIILKKAINKKHEYQYIFFEEKNIRYYELTSNEIANISLKLVDEHNKPLPLSPGEATFIKFKLQQETMKTIPINISSKNIYSEFNNTNSKFKVKLSPTLDFTKLNVKAGITSITYPNIITNIPIFIKNNIIVISEEIRQENPPEEEEENMTYVASYSIGNRTFSTTPIYVITKKYSIPLTGNVIFSDIEYIKKLNSEIKSKANNCITFELLQPENIIDIKFNKKCTLNIPIDFLEFFGIIETSVIGRKENDSYIMELNEDEIDGSIICDKPMNLRHFQPKYVIVYCSMIKPSIVGNKYMPIFKTIPLNYTNIGDYVTYEFEHIEYFDLTTTYISTFETEIRSSSGDLINFENPDSEVFIGIDFKQFD